MSCLQARGLEGSSEAISVDPKRNSLQGSEPNVCGCPWRTGSGGDVGVNKQRRASNGRCVDPHSVNRIIISRIVLTRHEDTLGRGSCSAKQMS